jgi:hypothetical protein
VEQTLPDGSLSRIDGRRHHLHYNPARTGVRAWDLDHFQGVRVAVSIETNGLHGFSSHAPSNSCQAPGIPGWPMWSRFKNDALGPSLGC